MSADALLAIIAGRDTTGLIEVRCRSPRSGRIEAREWFPVADRNVCGDFIDTHARELDVYVGAAPRTRRDGGKAAIGRVWALWADIDTPEALARLWRFHPRPSLVIRSGTGSNVHAYWALTGPLEPVWAERANRRLAYHLGADIKATDAARILRPPGTRNHKTDPPGQVAIGYSTNSTVTVFDAVKNLPDPPSFPPLRPRAIVSDATRSDDPLLDIGAETYYTALTGRPAGYGNVCCPFPAHKGGTEQSPSMRLYDLSFNCFGCGIGGSIIQFGAGLYEYPLPVRGDDFKELSDRLRKELL